MHLGVALDLRRAQHVELDFVLALLGSEALGSLQQVTEVDEAWGSPSSCAVPLPADTAARFAFSSRCALAHHSLEDGALAIECSRLS